MLDHVDHTFGPGETIRAIIRKLNQMAVDDYDLKMLVNEYNKLNKFVVPRPGDKVKIPIFRRIDSENACE